MNRLEVGHCSQCCDEMAVQMEKTHTMMGCYNNPFVLHTKRGNCANSPHNDCEHVYMKICTSCGLVESQGSINNITYTYGKAEE